MYASQHGYATTANLLIANGADVEAKDEVWQLDFGVQGSFIKRCSRCRVLK
jgi:hypothetical protein